MIQLTFNAADKPENMGQLQLVEDMMSFLNDRKDILVDAVVSDNGTKLTFTKLDGSQGFATLNNA